MEAIYSSETSADSQQTTRRYIPEDITLHKFEVRKINEEHKKKINIIIICTSCKYAVLTQTYN
jgi:hypothetical protein